jgi:hypothetical protein
MKALGKGSIASLVRTGLQIAWIVLWALALGLLAAGVGYVLLLVLQQTGMIPPDAEILELLAPTEENPAGLIWPVALPYFLIGAVSLGGALVIVSRLGKLFDGFSSGEPFRKDNAQHLRAIWVAMLVVEICRYLLMALMGALLTVFGPQNGVGVQRIELSIDLSTWGSILILIVLAEVFREGARLKEEQELTI